MSADAIKTIKEAPDHIGAIASAICLTYTITCGRCSKEQSEGFGTFEAAVIGFLQIGWRKFDTYVLCPDCQPKNRSKKL